MMTREFHPAIGFITMRWPHHVCGRARDIYYLANDMPLIGWALINNKRRQSP